MNEYKVTRKCGDTERVTTIGGEEMSTKPILFNTEMVQVLLKNLSVFKSKSIRS